MSSNEIVQSVGLLPFTDEFLGRMIDQLFSVERSRQGWNWGVTMRGMGSPSVTILEFLHDLLVTSDVLDGWVESEDLPLVLYEFLALDNALFPIRRRVEYLYMTYNVWSHSPQKAAPADEEEDRLAVIQRCKERVETGNVLPLLLPDIAPFSENNAYSIVVNFRLVPDNYKRFYEVVNYVVYGNEIRVIRDDNLADGHFLKRTFDSYYIGPNANEPQGRDRIQFLTNYGCLGNATMFSQLFQLYLMQGVLNLDNAFMDQIPEAVDKRMRDTEEETCLTCNKKVKR